MTAALLDRRAVGAAEPKCPVWCTNKAHPSAAETDMCDAGGGERWHTGRIGGVVLPSRVDQYYDEEIGVELFRTHDANGTVSQFSVLITYACEMQEAGHVTLDLVEARQLVDAIRTRAVPDGDRSSRQVRFGDPAANNILTERPIGYSTSEFVMTVEGRQERMSLHRTQLECLGDLVACALVLAGVTR